MSDRDELTEFLFEHIADPDGPGSDLSYTLREDDVWLAVNGNLDVQNLASDLLHGGYRKPRTITTVEELDAMPLGAVVLSDQGAIFECFSTPGFWQEPGFTWIPRSGDVSLPATVLYEPEAASE